jgi:hypothetical protein
MIYIDELKQRDPGLYYAIVSGFGGGDPDALTTEGGSPILAEDGKTLIKE